VVDNRLYAVGGSVPGPTTILTVNEVYDPTLDTWETRASMPIARRDMGIGVVNGKIYAIGGDDISKADVGTDEEYTPAALNPSQLMLHSVRVEIHLKKGNRSV
jgi:Kelch motif protein